MTTTAKTTTAKTTATKAPATKKATTAKQPARPAAKKSTKKSSDRVVTDYVTGLFDSAKDIVDSVLDTAGDVEQRTRTNARKATKAVLPSRQDVKDLRTQIEDLGKQTRKLAKLGK